MVSSSYCRIKPNPVSLGFWVEVVAWRATLIPLLILSGFHCEAQTSPAQFQLPETPPLFQVIADLDSALEWDAHQKKTFTEILNDFKNPPPAVHADSPGASQSVNLLFGLMVPIAADGYCLTAAHNIGQGAAMETFASQIGGHAFGGIYTMVDLGRPGLPLFHPTKATEGHLVCITRKKFGRSSRYVASASPRSAIKVLSRVLDRDEFALMQGELEAVDAAFLIRVKVLKVWVGDDLALIKLPFPTPSYFEIPTSDAAITDPLMCFGNPSLHKGVINQSSKVWRKELDFKIPLRFTEFVPLKLDLRRNFRDGDSGGPVIDGKGNLIGIAIATYADGKGKDVGFAVGLRRAPIMKTVEEFRSQIK